MLNDSLFSSKSNEWETPQKFFDELNKEFHFTLDPCATPENAKCKKYYTQEENGLLKSWENEVVFCNPPYGRELCKWVEKAYKEAEKGATVVMLIPARTDTQYFHDYIYHKHEVRFLKGRLHFNDSKHVAPFPSIVVVMKHKKEK